MATNFKNPCTKVMKLIKQITAINQPLMALFISSDIGVFRSFSKSTAVLFSLSLTLTSMPVKTQMFNRRGTNV